MPRFGDVITAFSIEFIRIANHGMLMKSIEKALCHTGNVAQGF